MKQFYILSLLMASFCLNTSHAYHENYYRDNEDYEWEMNIDRYYRIKRQMQEDNRYREHQLCMQHKNTLLSIGKDPIGLNC